jgi:hypothetical protein
MAKKEKIEQFGVRYPDGRIEWEGGGSLLSIHDADQRARFVSERELKLQGVGVKDDPGVVFLRRYRVITHTEPEIVG